MPPEASQSINEIDNNGETNIQIKIPPIFLHDGDNYKDVIKDIKQIIKSGFTTLYKGSQLKIIIAYHTFQDPNNNKIIIVLRGLPKSITEAEIHEELTELGYKVNKITRLYYKEHQTPNTTLYS